MPMKVMMIVMDEQRVILDWLYESIGRSFDSFSIFRLSSDEQKNLGAFFKRNNPLKYDRVVIFSRLKRLASQHRLLRIIPGVVFLEHDACQNYMVDSPNYGAYTRFYRHIPGCRVISSGLQVTENLRKEGVDAEFVSKGFDDKFIENRHSVRDIPAAFIGSVKHGAYRKRSEMLAEIAHQTPLRIERTESGEAYVAMLNRIRVFVSADSGMKEYMIKNFEALAAGCILLTEDQGKSENEALGFCDMENVMLYRTASEAVEKIAIIESDPGLGRRIAKAGEALASERFGFSTIGPKIAEVISKPLPQQSGLNVVDRMYIRLFHPWILVS